MKSNSPTANNTADIYFEGRIYKGPIPDLNCFSTDKQVWQYLNDKLKYYEVIEPHPFINYRQVVEGKDYELKYQWLLGFITPDPKWANCSKEEYDFPMLDAKDNRRIVAVPLAPQSERKNEILANWIFIEKKKCADAGEEFFLDFPDKWYEGNNGLPTYADINGHISNRYLKSEKMGNVCLECREPVWLCPPNTTEEFLKELLNQSTTPAADTVNKTENEDE